MINNEWDVGLKALKKSPKRAAVRDVEEAAALVGGALDTAARQLLGPDVVFLSGGVASVLAATAAVRAHRSPLLVTVTTDTSDKAQALAHHLGLDLLVAPLRPESPCPIAAVVNEALASALKGVGAKYAWTGSGADVLFAPYQGESSLAGPLRLDWPGRSELIRRICASGARSPHPIHDMPLTHIGLRVFGFFEGSRCLLAASRIAPEALSTHVPGTPDGEITSKAPLSVLARSWGVPAELISSGTHESAVRFP